MSIASVKKHKEHIGIKIKRLRASKGMTQQELADKIGKTRSLVSHFETSGIINKYTLQEIADALQIKVDSLLTNTDEKYKAPEDQQPIADNAAAYIISPALQQLIDKYKEEVSFLKDTINNQWKLLHELSKSGVNKG